MGRKDVNCQGRAGPISHPHQHNCQQEVYRVTPPRGFKGDSSIPWAALLGIAPPLCAALKGEPDGEGATHQPNVLRSNGYWPLQVQNSTRHLSKMLNSMDLKLQRLKSEKIKVKS